jgi:protein-S-isoprenylcysteine O-methyltransferase Ste14
VTLIDAVVVAAYVSLLVEITVFAIPSEASCWQLLAATPGDPVAEAAPDHSALRRAQGRSFAAKLARYLLPTALGVALFAIPLLVIAWPPLLDRLLPLAWLQRAEVAAAGLVLVVAGRAVTFASVLQLRRCRAQGQLRAAGLFAFSRNPGLVGMFAFYLGLCCLCPSAWLWLGVPLYFGNMHRRVLMEEADLLRKHGASWLQYSAQVHRYLGRAGGGAA